MKRDLTVLKAILDADYKRHVKRFKTLKPNKDVVFIGDSIVAYFPLKQYVMDDYIHNLGIPGDTSKGVYARLEQVYALKPKTVILHIGINDDALLPYETKDTIKQIELIVEELNRHLPQTQVIVVSLTPINQKDFPSSTYVLHRHINFSKDVNKAIKRINNVIYLDLYALLVGDQEQLKSGYTTDGIHLNEAGYATYRLLLQQNINLVND